MMVAETITKQSVYNKKVNASKIILWLFIGSIIMLFAGLTSAYIVRQAEGEWLQFELPEKFYFSTFVILLSSVPMALAVKGIKKNKIQEVLLALLLTLILGCVFSWLQFAAWGELVNNKIYFTGNPSGSFLYVISGLHLLHLFGGIIFLIVVIIKTFFNQYNPLNYHGLSMCATYWHFLDGLWIYLFLFLLFVR